MLKGRKRLYISFQATLFKKKYNHKKGNKITFSHFMASKVHQAAQIFITYCDIWEDYILQCRAITTAQMITSQCLDLDYDPCHWKLICVLKVDQF